MLAKQPKHVRKCTDKALTIQDQEAGVNQEKPFRPALLDHRLNSDAIAIEVIADVGALDHLDGSICWQCGGSRPACRDDNDPVTDLLETFQYHPEGGIEFSIGVVVRYDRDRASRRQFQERMGTVIERIE